MTGVGALDSSVTGYHDDPMYQAYRLMLGLAERVVGLVGQDDLPKSDKVRMLLDADSLMSVEDLVAACHSLGLTVKITVERRRGG